MTVCASDIAASMSFEIMYAIKCLGYIILCFFRFVNCFIKNILYTVIYP